MAATLSLLKSPILPQKPHHPQPKLPVLSNPTKQITFSESFNPPKLFTESIHHLKSASLPFTTVALPFFLDTKDALAVDGEFGILEGRSFALIHPIVMGGLFFYTLWSGYLGWQWRRVRTIQNEINELKKQVKPAPVTPEGKPLEAAASPVELKIQQLTEERKELLKGSYRDRHYNAGSILLGFGVLEAVGGGVNTWFRTGKLFPGPHLFAGAAITVLWAAAAALVPSMQKGSETARSLHIALNAVNVILFIWQIPTALAFKGFDTIMSNQPAPTRPWFRLASLSRPAPPAPIPTPEPAPAPPRPATVRPALRPPVQAQPPPTQAQATGVSSVPTSPVAVGRASQPSSPSDRKPTSPTTIPVGATSSSVPSSPVKTVPATSPPKTATTASLPSSPAKQVATIGSVPTSPAKTVATTASVPTSPVKTVATTASVPTSPAKTVATTVSVPTSPAKTAPTTTSMAGSPTQKPATSVTTTARVPSPKASITTVKPAIQSPIESPKIKSPTAPPPSPLALPPSQLKAQAELENKIPVEAEQKTVLVQKMIDKPKEGWLFGASQKNLGDTRNTGIPLNGQKEPSKNGETKDKGHGKKFSSDSEDASMRVITIAGENKGAFMELIKSPHKNGFQGSPNHLQKKANSSRIGSDGSDYQSYSSSGEEGDRKAKDKSKASKTMPMNAFMNSNVQGVNNSIVYNSSCTHHDPGVHLSLLRKPTAGGFHVKERANGYNS